jgi:hypothetical protein
MPFNLFGKKDKPVDPQEAITKLKDSEEMLDKKSKHLEMQIGKELQAAKQHGTKNKRAALNALKRKKRLEQQLTQIDNTLTTIEFQREALQNARSNAEILKTMQTASKAMKTVHKEVNIENVEDVMDDIQEQQDIAAEISEAISRPIAMPGVDMDEDDLLAELEELEQEELDAELINAGSANVPATSLPSVPTTQLPQVPAQQQAVEEDADLAELEAWAS